MISCQMAKQVPALQGLRYIFKLSDVVNIQTDHLIIGAGLAGCGIALELARRGKRSVLIEQDAMPMNRASLRNEGKIHLGLIYAADSSFETAHLQLQGALQFHSILAQWLGSAVTRIEQSTPFFYLVAKDSLYDPEQLESHYQKLERSYSDLLKNDSALNYLGDRPTWLTQRVSMDTLDPVFAKERFQAAFATNEKAINTDHLAQEIRQAVQNHPHIKLLSNHQVTHIEHVRSSYEITAASLADQEAFVINAATVFNAAWDQRLGLDQQVGMELPKGWLHRLKYRVIVKTPPEFMHHPSATIVLGAYGDVVMRQDSAYLSWYPSGLRGWTHDLVPPKDWSDICSNHGSDLVSQTIGAEILAKTIEWYPRLEGSEIITVDAGAIFAYGQSDVDDPSSRLHHRNKIGVFRKGNYFSVDPGKLTTGPMYAVQAVNEALQESQHA